MAARTSACSALKRTGSGWAGTDDGRADSAAPVHIGRSAAGMMHGAPRTERLDQGAVLPQGALDVGAGRPGDAPPDRRAALRT